MTSASNDLIEFGNLWLCVESFKFGGMSKIELSFLYTACKNRDVLELGSEVGQSSYIIAAVANSLVCVDAWDESYNHLDHDKFQKSLYLKSKEKKGDIFKGFKNNCHTHIENNKLQYIKGRTNDVVDQFKNSSFDIIFIDADHSYKGVRSDIDNYLSKLKTGGLMLFHDYGIPQEHGGWPGVKKACTETVNTGKLSFILKAGGALAVFAKN